MWLATLLEPVTLSLRLSLSRPGEPIAFVYFPETGVCSVVNHLADGHVVEVGTIGPEGMAGLQAFLDADSAPSECFVQVAGHGYRAPAAEFVAGAEERPAVRRALKRYTHAYLVQVSQTASCNSGHDVGERCARWLLMTQDRVGAESFELTHQFLAIMLGVRRAGVTVALGILKRAGLVRYSRGKVTVLDRAGLEAASCECYAIVRGEFDRLLGGVTPGS